MRLRYSIYGHMLFFKAGLFLAAGVIIHHLHQIKDLDGQDIRQMGGLRKKLPWTFASFMICGLALAGIPFFSGFMSKEGILLAAWSWADQYGTWAYLIPDIGLITILITAFYVGKLLFLTFLGDSRMGDVLEKIRFNENTYIKVPLTILAMCSVWFIYNPNPLAHDSWLDTLFGQTEMISGAFAPIATTGIAMALSLTGLTLAFLFFRRGSQFASSYSQTTNPASIGGSLLFNGFYLTNAYGFLGKTIYSSGRGLSWVDKRIDGLLHFTAVGSVVVAKVLSIVDRLFVDGLVNFFAWFASFLGGRTSGLHSKESQWQIIWLLIAIVLILTWILLF